MHKWFWMSLSMLQACNVYFIMNSQVIDHERTSVKKTNWKPKNGEQSHYVGGLFIGCQILRTVSVFGGRCSLITSCYKYLIKPLLHKALPCQQLVLEVVDALLAHQCGLLHGEQRASAVTRAEHTRQVWSQGIYLCLLLSFSNFSFFCLLVCEKRSV